MWSETFLLLWAHTVAGIFSECINSPQILIHESPGPRKDYFFAARRITRSRASDGSRAIKYSTWIRMTNARSRGVPIDTRIWVTTPGALIANLKLLWSFDCRYSLLWSVSGQDNGPSHQQSLTK